MTRSTQTRAGVRNVAFVTLGCPKNEVDSDRMAASLGPGFALVDSIDRADVVVVNTCAFIREATEESIAVVLDVAGDWKAAAPDRILVVTGCMPSRYGEELSGSDGIAPRDSDNRVRREDLPYAERRGALETSVRSSGITL